MLKDGKLNAYWIMCNNNLQAAPNTNNETYPGYRNPANFIVVSDAYPTVTAMAADLILPAAMWVEKEGAYGNAERRTHFWRQLVNAPGEARSDLWQLMEFSKRFTTDEVWPAEILAPSARVPRQDAVRRALPQRRGRQVPARRDRRRLREPRGEGTSASTSRRACSRNTPRFGRGHGHDLAPFDTYHQVRGLRWPVVDGKETRWRYREGLDPYVEKRARASQFYGNPDGRANIIARALRAAGRSRPTRSSTSGSSPAACWSTGIPAR